MSVELCPCGCGRAPCPPGMICLAKLRYQRGRRSPLDRRRADCFYPEALGRVRTRHWWRRWVAEWKRLDHESTGQLDLLVYAKRTGDDLKWLQ